MILDAINSGAEKIILFIGGTATNDIGVGMLEALGFKFYNDDGELVLGQVKNIPRVVKIESPGLINRLQEISFVVACDVSNKLLGPKGQHIHMENKKVRVKSRLKHWRVILGIFHKL